MNGVILYDLLLVAIPEKASAKLKKNTIVLTQSQLQFFATLNHLQGQLWHQ